MLSVLNKYFKLIPILVIMVLGIFIRTHVFLQKVSFFCDEGALLLNLYDKSYTDLFFPLKYIQQAPPFFLIISKFFLMKFGLNELMLRLIPYLSSIFSLLLFYPLCRRVLKNNISTTVAILLFALNMPLIEVSQVFKQYSSDALFSVIAMLIVFNIDFKNITTKRVLLLSFLTVLSFWFAYPMVIIAFLFAFLFLIMSFLSKKRTNIKYSLIFTGINIIGVLLYYFTNLHGPALSNDLHSFWATSPGFFPNSIHEFIGLNHFVFNINNLIELILVFILILLGATSLIKNDKFKFFVVILPVISTFFLAVMQVYPFIGRLIIFLIPNFIILIASSLDLIDLKKNSFLSVIVLSLASFFIISTKCIPYFANFIISGDSYEKSFTREYVELLKKEKLEKNSIIYITPIMGVSFNVYIKDSFLSKYQILNPLDDMTKIPRKRIVYFYNAYNKVSNNSFDENAFYSRQKWVKNHCKILKEMKIKDKKFIKCYVE